MSLVEQEGHCQLAPANVSSTTKMQNVPTFHARSCGPLGPVSLEATLAEKGLLSERLARKPPRKTASDVLSEAKMGGLFPRQGATLQRLALWSAAKDSS